PEAVVQESRSASGAATVDREPNLTAYASYNARAGAEATPDVEIQQVEAAPTDRTGIVSINCQVPARIYINGQYSGTTPRAVHLNAGEYQIRLVSDGYLEWNSKVKVRDRQQMGVLASMTRAE
ncbi:MAG: PEGA domain-containing protein, partial [Blastocatellia bacterium]